MKSFTDDEAERGQYDAQLVELRAYYEELKEG